MPGSFNCRVSRKVRRLIEAPEASILTRIQHFVKRRWRTIVKDSSRNRSFGSIESLQTMLKTLPWWRNANCQNETVRIARPIPWFTPDLSWIHRDAVYSQRLLFRILWWRETWFTVAFSFFFLERKRKVNARFIPGTFIRAARVLRY